MSGKPGRWWTWLAGGLAALLVLLGGTLLLAPTIKVPGGPTLTRDVTYAVAGGAELKLDILQPVADGAVKHPVAVFIHGGGWRGGDKAGGALYLARLVREGYLCFSINYRLVDEAHFPAQIHDCKAAIRWIRAQAAEYGGDPGRIAVFGSSAGGHLALLLGLSNGVAELEGNLGEYCGVSSDVQAVADWFGPSDFLAWQQDDLSDWHRGLLEDLLGQPLADARELAAQASPVTWIDAGDPPVLIIHGDADDTVPVEQSRHLHELLQAAGVPVEYHEVPGGGHGKFRGTDPDFGELLNFLVAFFDRQLGTLAAVD